MEIIFTFLYLVLVANHAIADLSPGAYWKATLPNTPIPNAVKVLLFPESRKYKNNAVNTSFKENLINIGINPSPNAFSYDYVPSNRRQGDQVDKPSVTLFFLEKNLRKLENTNLDFSRRSHGTTTLLPRTEAQSIPFSSKRFQDILDRFSISPNSSEAEIVKQSIGECEQPNVKGEERYCATSLEAMVDFVTSKLGEDVKAVSTEIVGATRLQEYNVAGVRKLAAKEAVVCHWLDYAYVVFYCHKTSTATTRAYVAYLAGGDGARVKAVAVCHVDTSSWNPKHLAFQVLGVKPGTVPICHFLPEDHVVWVAK